jgi:hypothetical protein
MTQLSPAKDLYDQLIADGITLALFVNSEPDGKNEAGAFINNYVTTIYDTSLEPPNPKFLLDNVGIQVRSRGTEFQSTYANILSVFNKLAGRPAFTRNTTRYTGIFPQTSIFTIGRDEANRWLLAFNARVILEPEADGQYRQAL